MYNIFINIFLFILNYITMYKTLINKDELVEQHKLGGNQFSKIDKITKKEMR